MYLVNAGGKIKSVSGLYSIKPGGVKRLRGLSDLFVVPSCKQSPLAFAVPFSIQHPVPPLTEAFAQAFPRLKV